MTTYTWIERKKKGKGRMTLQEKFTSNELILMKVIFQNEMDQTDANYNSYDLNCCKLIEAIRTWSGNPYNLTMDALIYLGYLTEQGEISEYKLNKRYFNQGPVEGSSQFESSPNDAEIYVTKAGFNLIQRVVQVFYSQAHLSFTNIIKVTTL
jgi:hypothetical protein